MPQSGFFPFNTVLSWQRNDNLNLYYYFSGEPRWKILFIFLFLNQEIKLAFWMSFLHEPRKIYLNLFFLLGGLVED